MGALRLLLLLLHQPNAHLLLGLKSLLDFLNNCNGLWLKRGSEESFKTLHVKIVLRPFHGQIKVYDVKKFFFQEVYLLELDAANVAQIAIQVEGVGVVFMGYQHRHQDQPVDRQRVDADR